MKSNNSYLNCGVLILLISIVLISCSSSSSASSKKGEKKEQRMSYLALGDSYTIGERVKESQNFPNQLIKELANKGYPFDSPIIVAKTGWRTDELLEGIEKAELTEKVDLVSILIGVNNQYQGRPIELFKEDLNKIIDQAILYSKKGEKGVFAFSIPDYSVMPIMRGEKIKKIATEIDQYNLAYRKACKSRGILFYNVTKLSRLAKDDTSLVADDKLHPNEKMYEMWVQKKVHLIIENILQ